LALHGHDGIIRNPLLNLRGGIRERRGEGLWCGEASLQPWQRPSQAKGRPAQHRQFGDHRAEGGSSRVVLHAPVRNARVTRVATKGLLALVLICVLSGFDYATRILYRTPWQTPQQRHAPLQDRAARQHSRRVTCEGGISRRERFPIEVNSSSWFAFGLSYTRVLRTQRGSRPEQNIH
jgi:hypothetical protein